MNLTPVSEISSTAEYEEEKELVGIISQASSVEKKAETKPKVKGAMFRSVCMLYE